MKSRYESDYLREHREKLVVASRLDEILSGKSDHGDGSASFSPLPSARRLER